jgi:hypothetical protein
MRTLMSTLGVLVCAGALVSGCTAAIGADGNPTVSKGALQTDIADRLTKAGERPESVTCIQDLVGEVGKTARCEVVISSTNSFEPVVTVTGVDGDTIDYEKAVSLLVTRASGVPVDSVACETGLEGNVGAAAHCDVDAGGVKLRRTVEVGSVEGLMMNFDVVPMLTKAEVESSLLDEFEKQGGRRPDFAECSGNLEGKPGTTVDCTVVRGPETRAFTLTVTTVAGSKINYRYAPKA